MSLLAQIVLRTTVLVAVALAAMPLLRSRSAALRHWVLSVALACAAVMPVLTLVAPRWQVPLTGGPIALTSIDSAQRFAAVASPRGVVTEVVTIEPRSTRAADSAPTGADMLATAWAAGSTLALALLFVGLARLRHIAKRSTRVNSGPWNDLAEKLAREAGVNRPVTLLMSGDPTLLVTWGIARPKIVLPLIARDWPDERVTIVLRHELAHIRRGDWLLQVLAELARAAYWFNPVMWHACRRLRRESELACDDALLNGGVIAADYASHLVDLARTLYAHRRRFVPAPAMARRSGLERRIAAMLDRRLNRTPLTHRAQAVAAVTLVAFALSLAGLRAQRFPTFSGTLTDQTNAVLPNVAVSVANAAAQTRHEVRTDRTGHFELPGLTDGDYQVSIDEPGFKPVRDTLHISGRDVSRALQLTVGDLQETISVTAGKAKASDPTVRQAARDYAAARNRKVVERCSGDAAPGAGAIGGNIMQPTKVVDVKPLYPEGHTPGVVTLEALIGTDGTIREVHSVSGDPDLGFAASEAIRQWEFTPTYLNCTPIEVRMGVTARFVGQ